MKVFKIHDAQCSDGGGRTKEASMLGMLMELLVIGFVLGLILVVAFVVRWFVHFAE